MSEHSALWGGNPELCRIKAIRLKLDNAEQRYFARLNSIRRTVQV